MKITTTIKELREEIFGTSKILKTSKHVKQAIETNKLLTFKKDGKITYDDKKIELIKSQIITSFKTQPLDGKTRRNGSALSQMRLVIMEKF